MSKVSLNALGKKLAEKTGISQQEAELFIKKMFDVTNEGLQSDKQVKVKWLGTFKVTSVKDRESVDVNTGERIVIEGRDKISFTPDNILKEIVNKPFAQFETVVVNDGVEFDDIDQKFASEEEMGEQIVEPAVVDDSAEAVPAVEQSDSSKVDSKDTVLVNPVSLDQVPEEEPVADSVVDSVSVIEPVPLADPSEESSKESSKNEALVEEPVAKESVAKESVAKEVVAVVDTSVNIADASASPRHIVLPRYVVAVACLVVVALLGCIGWFAFNYGKMAAQRDQLALQLDAYQQTLAKQEKVVKPASPSQDEILKQKALQDSIRLAQANEAVKLAETEANQKEETQDNLEVEKTDKSKAKENSKELETKKLASRETEMKKSAEKTGASVSDKSGNKLVNKQADKSAEMQVSKYDKDVRVRTGAYRIVGVAQVVTAKEGQTVEGLSKAYLGPGMECYVEALNGAGKLKAGQKIKIPKLELKKKKQK